MTYFDEQRTLAHRLRKSGHESVSLSVGEETCLLVDGIPRALTELRSLEQQESDMEQAVGTGQTSTPPGVSPLIQFLPVPLQERTWWKWRHQMRAIFSKQI